MWGAWVLFSSLQLWLLGGLNSLIAGRLISTDLSTSSHHRSSLQTGLLFAQCGAVQRHNRHVGGMTAGIRAGEGSE